VSPACPTIVRDDCNQRVLELDAVTPTVVFVWKDPDGSDRSDVKVFVEGRLWANKLDGTPVAIDPGPRTFTFVAPERPAVIRHFVFREGDKGRRELVSLAGPGEARPKVATLLIQTSDGNAVVIDQKPTAVGAWSGTVDAGTHDVLVTREGKVPDHVVVELPPGGARTLDVTLQDEKKGLPTWAWIAGGAALVAGAIVGGYFLFRADDESGAHPVGGLGTVMLSFGGSR
jgi:hypothetical protein